MKWLLLIALIFCCTYAHAENANDTSIRKVAVLKNKSLISQLELKNGWLYKAGDDIKWASINYNDSGWQGTLTSDLSAYTDKDKHLDFPGIGWFRYNFTIDSVAANGRSVGIRMSQGGASEIFLDGKKIKSFGTINGKSGTEQYNPVDVPFSLPVTTGQHVLAIRYANYLTEKMYSYDESAGFHLRIGYLDDLIEDSNDSTITTTSIMMLLLGIFSMLSIIHLFLYFYYREAKANLYFGIFMASLATFFTSIYINTLHTSVTLQMRAIDFMMVSAMFAIFSMSGFSNELFSKKKRRFRVISLFSLAFLLVWILFKKVAYTFFFALIIVVLIEMTILSIRGIYRKIPGSKLIGSGIAYFALFLLISVIALVSGQLSFEGDSASFGIYVFLLVLAALSIPASISLYLAWNFARTSKNLSAQLIQVQELSEKTLEQEQDKKRMLESRQEELEKEVAVRTTEVREQKEEIEKQNSELKSEKKKSDDLLLNILPEEIAQELKDKGTSEAKYFDHVSVIFTDFVNFTKAGERMTPQELVNELHTCFKAFDNICSKYNIEKIKTIGDAYLAVCGLPIADPNHAINTTRAAVEIREFIAARTQQLPDKTFHIRIGIHSGSVVAGIVGVKKFAYDIWGDTVNTAARMEQHGESGKINISQNTYDLVKSQFNCTFRGQITAKNKGDMNMYFVEEEK